MVRSAAGRPWAVSPAGADERSLARVALLLELCGAVRVDMAPAEHDAAVALVSHVPQVAASLVLVALAAAISVWQRADLERDIVIATARSIVQLTLVGYAIKLIFDALADQAPGIRRTAAATRLRSGWLNGLKTLGVAYS